MHDKNHGQTNVGSFNMECNVTNYIFGYVLPEESGNVWLKLPHFLYEKNVFIYT